ncbi:hypothetical protein Syun_021642 [Stephania yunnanensis]|uniref:Cytochrome P450 n=1 Tax=Stephania yunnanensis TaxID=152371 RepID=A0AAP0IGF6_9MAGN
MPPLFTLLLLIIITTLTSVTLLIIKTNKTRSPPSKQKHKQSQPSILPPGPLLRLPILGHLHLLGSNPHRDLRRLSNRHGPIMHLRLGQVPAIVVSSPQSAKLFLKVHDLAFAGRPRVQASEYLSYGQKGLVFAQYGPFWRDMRKLCTLELLTNAKVEMFKGMRREEVCGVVEEVRGVGVVGGVVELSEMVGRVVEDMSYRMICGSKDGGEFEFKESIKEMSELFGAFNLSDFVPFLRPFDLQGLVPRMKSLSKELDRKLMKIIEQHIQDTTTKQEGKDYKDFIDIMLSLMESNNEHEMQLDLDHIKAIVMDMIGASTDTSATAILWIFSELLKHPNVRKQVQDEVRNIIGMDRMVEETDLVKLKFLNMAIKEGLRLHPVIPLVYHENYEKDVVVDNYFIPKKARIIINVWAIGRDPNAWSDSAEEFDPSRFANSDIEVYGQDFQLIPFGSGRRGCPGLQLGLRVVQLVLAQLLHCFDWELPYGMLPCDVDMTEKFGLAISRAKPLLAKPTFRLNINL